MRGFRVVAACVGLALPTAAHAADPALQTALLNEYVTSVCAQASPTAACDGNWSTFAQAGMNDIDRRCDAFLAWATERSHGEKPTDEKTVLGRLMTLSGPSPESLDVAATAFGLPNPSQAAQRLASVDRLTVLQIVFTGRMQFRTKIMNDVVPDRPAAIDLLRDYLQLCMPAAIEASLNAGASK
jgi:hypothetical protein